jgi:glycine cleavage system H protein
MSPNDRSYTQEHEWIIVEDTYSRRALVGITHFAQDQLGDIVYFELPKVGDSVSHLGKMGEVESVKAVSDLYSPVSGEVIEVNAALVDRPELTNEDPFGNGWLVRVTMSDLSELDTLMSSEEYDAYVAEQH